MKKVLSLLLTAVVIASSFAGTITAYAAALKPGDVNKDRKVNSTDALEILMISIGKMEKTDDALSVGDIDGDGKLGSSDALMILQYYVGVEFTVQKVVVNKKDTICKKGDIITATGKAYPLFAKDTSVEWSSSNEKIAQVSNVGSIKVLENGSCTITCKSKENPKVSASFKINCGIKATSVTLNKKSDSVAMGKSIQLQATVAPADAYCDVFTWKSSDSSIASVDEKGKVKAKSMGTATITCTTTDGSNKSAKYTITVNMMKVPYVNQMSAYPTGCEAASSCMLLKYYGFSITMDQMVNIIPRENLVNKNGKWYGPDINEKFVGDPRYGYRSSIRGYGAFSPCITKALQKAIDQRGGGYTAKNLKGCTIDTLYKTVSEGKPAVVWATYNMNNPTEVNAWYINTTGKYFEYPKGTHVMVLCGYDKNYVYVMDPYESPNAKKFSKSTFKSRWELLGKQAIVLEKNK
ncbi:MAG: Ig-like domain-containing protein [Clostridia bacterium]|nr:Ig-like domain-containing protein [Clostridia bacterium]